MIKTMAEAEKAGLGWLSAPADIDSDATCPYCRGPLAGRRNWHDNETGQTYCSFMCAEDAKAGER